MDVVLVAQTRVTYEWLRVEQFDQWWHWGLLALVVVATVSFIFLLYRRDAAALPRIVGLSLLVLRIGAFAGLFFHFMHLEKRTQRRTVRQSRLAVLVDTSHSMGLAASQIQPLGGSGDSGATVPSRSELAATLLADSDLLRDLQTEHQLTVYRYADGAQPTVISSFKKPVEETSIEDANADELGRLATGRNIARASLGLLGVSLLLSFMVTSGKLLGARQLWWLDWSVPVAAASLMAGLVLLGVAMLPNTTFTLSSLLSDTAQRNPTQDDVVVETPGSEATSDQGSTGQESLDNDGQQPSRTPLETAEQWAEAIVPSGPQTRLGDAIGAILEQETGNPLAGIVIVTDGQNNEGVSAESAAAAGAANKVPLHFVGLGSPSSPRNVRLAELDLQKRIYPGDRFILRALVANSSMSGENVSVQVLAGRKDAPEDEMAIESEKPLQLGEDGAVDGIEFKLEPKAVGTWDYVVRIVANRPDADAQDDFVRRSVEVVQRKTRVLIIAGGPTREYQFVRNLMYRDRDVESHVLLQTATDASSQEAQEILNAFPADRTELSNYDAIIAFDPDWTKIPEASIIAMEQWVAEQAGGFVMVAGTVEMPKWVSRSGDGVGASKLRALSPVVIPLRGSRLTAAGRIEAVSPWPLAITQDGKQSAFMSIAESGPDALAPWQDFDGVYGYYAVHELKPGAKSLAEFSDPQTAVSQALPIYLASQFYGSGRTVFIGGGEMWRIRSLGDDLFDRFYIKLLRWVSGGRLLMDSDRGMLSVSQEQGTIGEQVSVRAIVKTAQYEPLIQSELVARLIDSAGRNEPLVLRPLPDGAQPGIYSGQFPLLTAGEYQIELQLDGIGSETLRASVEARVPAAELEKARRDDVLMTRLAAETGGQYWPVDLTRDIAEALATEKTAAKTGSQVAFFQRNDSGKMAIADALPSQDTISYIPGATDRSFQVRQLGWLMAWIASCLALEWLFRRSYRLA
ncbi:MAG TPA: hypothetical protein DDW52_06930 [Planctomycetaceae bacterium]|nr:hypothetical protein [Planctomycetaceae bacterium]